jgi:ABC-type antimicrobial peptide transport system permease subunit
MSGVFGLATLILSKKMKDISVRKVLGANMLNVSFLINKEFLTAIITAGLFGLPISYWVTNTLFKQISPESSTSFLLLILSFIVLCLITFMSIAWHIFKSYTSNPITYLRDE